MDWLSIIMAFLPVLLKILTDLLSNVDKRKRSRDKKPMTATQRKTRDQAVAKLREAADKLEDME